MVAAITLIVVLLVGGVLTIHLFRKKNPIRYTLLYTALRDDLYIGDHASQEVGYIYNASHCIHSHNKPGTPNMLA